VTDAAPLPTIADEIERYIRTGDTDPHHRAWPAPHVIESARRAEANLRGALVAEVKRRAEGRRHHPVPEGRTVAFVRRRVEPMVRGLFPRAEHEAILAVLERSVVFVTSANIEQVIRDDGFDRSAWDKANLYLASVGAELLGPDAPRIVGLSENTTCYVSPEYFEQTDEGGFEDFIVHEAAHIFHNARTRTFGLKETRRRERLLDIDYGKRETFAYSCEVFSRVIERAKGPADRRRLAAEAAAGLPISDERVDNAEVADILREAAGVRNGWKVILRRCAEVRPPARTP